MIDFSLFVFLKKTVKILVTVRDESKIKFRGYLNEKICILHHNNKKCSKFKVILHFYSIPTSLNSEFSLSILKFDIFCRYFESTILVDV